MSEVASSLPFRLPSPRYLTLIAFWASFALWTGTGTIYYGGILLSGRQNPFAPAADVPILFALNAWSLAASAVFGLVVHNPFAWLNGRRLIFGSMAFALMLGRPFGGGLASLADMTGLMSYMPAKTLLIFVTTPFVLLLGGLTAIFTIATTIGSVFTFFVGIPIVLFNQIFEFDQAVTRYRFHGDGLASYIVRAVYWLRNQPRPIAPPDDSRGARLATLPEIRALYKPLPESMAFGHIKGAPFFLNTDKHVLIMASTRSGKGVTLIMPHLLRYQGSAFVLDPKGENAKGTGRRRAQLNDQVHYLDPFGISGQPPSRFNPLARFTPENMEAESKALAAAMFVVNPRNQDHWTASGQQLLAALILYVYVAADIPKENKDLPTVRKVLLGGLKPALDAMMLIDEAGGLLHDLAVSFLETPEKEFGSIASTAQRQTEILDNPFMIACLSATGDGPEVDFKAWHAGTMTVYLCLSAPKFPTFNRWLRLVLTSALDDMTDTLKPPALPVCFMLDELATLGHLPSVENAIGLAAGYGIQLVTVFQDVAQMRDLYKGRWASFIGNSGVRALFNLDDYDTAEYWSKFIGARIVESHSRQEDRYGLSNGQNVSETMRPLLASDQIMMDFASGKMLVLAQGAHPIISTRVAYWADSSLNNMWDDPRRPGSAQASVPPLSPGPQPSGPASPPPPSPPEPPVVRRTVRPPAPGPDSAARGNGPASPNPKINGQGGRDR